MTNIALHICLFVLLFQRFAWAEVITDGTFGPRQTLSGPDYAITAPLGTQQGANLFHSFHAFNLANGENAIFSGPATVEWIISRVTGGMPSHINGGIHAVIPDAEMYFLNPAGVLFGPNAYLDVPGGFHVSSAAYLRLADGGIVQALTPENSTLSIAPPAAFGFSEGTGGAIVVDGAKLQAPSGHKLSLISPDIRLQGGELRAEDGAVYLGGASLERKPDRFLTNYQFFSSGAHIDTSGQHGGTAVIQSGKVLFENSSLYADTYGDGGGGGVHIQAAESLMLTKGSRITAGAVAGRGNAGPIHLDAPRIVIKGLSQVAGSSESAGNAAAITVEAAKSLEITGRGRLPGRRFITNSGILANTSVFSSGDGGAIHVRTPELRLEEGGVIRADSHGVGRAGSIEIKAGNVELRNGGKIDLSTAHPGTGGDAGRLALAVENRLIVSGLVAPGIPSAIVSNTAGDSAGNLLEISARRLEITDNGTMQAGTRGREQAGRIVLRTEELVLDRAFITAETRGPGWGGNLEINAEKFSVRHSRITAEAGLSGGGDITVNAGEGVYALETEFSTRAAGSERQHKGGNLAIGDPEFMVFDDSRLLTTGFAGDGGNISLTANHLIKSADSVFDASSTLGTAGEIQIKAPREEVQRGLSATPAPPTDRALPLQTCAPRNPGNDSHFTWTGQEILAEEEIEEFAFGFYGDIAGLASVNEEAAKRLLQETENILRSGNFRAAQTGIRALAQKDDKLVQALLKNIQAYLEFFSKGKNAAVQRLNEALALHAGSPALRALLRMNLANIQGEIFHDSMDIPVLKVKAAINNARLASRAGDIKQALAQLTRARRFLSSLKDEESSDLWLKWGQAALKRKEIRQQARAVFRQAGNTAAKKGRRLYAQAAEWFAHTYATKNAEKALQYNRQALAALVSIDAPGLVYRLQWQRGRLLERQGRREAALTAYRQAVETVQRIRQTVTRTYQARGRSAYQEVFTPLFREFTNLLLWRAQKASPRMPPAQQDLREALKVLEQLKASALQDYFQESCIREMRRPLKPEAQTAVIYPVFLPDRAVMLVHLSDGITPVTVQVKPQLVSVAVRQLRDALACTSRQSACISADDYQLPAMQLYRWLFAPLENLLHGIHTVVFVPDGPLYQIPMGVLHDGKHFLAEKYYWAAVPGLTLSTPKSPDQSLRTGKVLFNGLTESKRYRPLLYAPMMKQSIQALFSQVEVLEGRDFVQPKLRKTLEAASYDLVHIFSHAHFAGQLEGSFIATYDAKLDMNALDVLMHRTPPALLVLSACGTATGSERAALGLSGAAFKAGAQSVAATLWEIKDDVAFALLEDFYRQLARADISKAQALSNAQRSLIARRFSPHYWAPFLLIGNWL
ncbi:MAG: CHAT domain-containing protein [Gammaproteobacteria bacterium]|nr:CHAT domain-containing protein [Gammaproteobacteria bacterium]